MGKGWGAGQYVLEMGKKENKEKEEGGMEREEDGPS